MFTHSPAEALAKIFYKYFKEKYIVIWFAGHPDSGKAPNSNQLANQHKLVLSYNSVHPLSLVTLTM